MTPTVLERYLQTVDLEKLLQKLEVSNAETVLKGIEHFTRREAKKRDKILLNYFGEDGINRIVDSVCDRLLSPPLLKNEATVLDVGAGSGVFTVKVATKLREKLSKASFYGMDITPAMLQMLMKKTDEVLPFLGVAENIVQSAKLARRYLNVPAKFDAIYSTLMLHHCSNVGTVFQSMRDATKPRGKAVVVDLCKHPFKEFREEMGDVHLGFEPDHIEKNAEKYFKGVFVDKLPGICCSSSGRCAELFIAYLTS